jgi:hypothetical protein
MKQMMMFQLLACLRERALQSIANMMPSKPSNSAAATPPLVHDPQRKRILIFFVVALGFEQHEHVT